MITEYECLAFKLCSVRDMLLFKQGYLNIILPDEIKDSKKVLTEENGPFMSKHKNKILTRIKKVLPWILDQKY